VFYLDKKWYGIFLIYSLIVVLIMFISYQVAAVDSTDKTISSAGIGFYEESSKPEELTGESSSVNYSYDEAIEIAPSSISQITEDTSFPKTAETAESIMFVIIGAVFSILSAILLIKNKKK